MLKTISNFLLNWEKKNTSNINSIFYDRLTISKAMLQMRNQNWKFQELLENFSWEILSPGTRGSRTVFYRPQRRHCS